MNYAIYGVRGKDRKFVCTARTHRKVTEIVARLKAKKQYQDVVWSQCF